MGDGAKNLSPIFSGRVSECLKPLGDPKNNAGFLPTQSVYVPIYLRFICDTMCVVPVRDRR